MVSMRDRIKAGLLGVACGDALGATVEFMHPREIREQYGVLREIVGGGWLKLDPGQVTDDTEMTFAVAQGIVESPDDPVPAIGARFIGWFEGGPIDVGGTCGLAIRIAIIKRKEGALNWSDVSEEVWRTLKHQAAGNGALMRTLPVALAYHRDPERLRVMAHNVAAMTHPAPEAIKSSVLYCRMVADLLAGRSKEEAFSRAGEWARHEGLGAVFGGGNRVIEPEGDVSGYSIHTLQAALWAFQTGRDTEDVIVRAANLGGDADTVAAIAGGLAGVYYGDVPERWVEALDPVTRNEIERLATLLFDVQSDL